MDPLAVLQNRIQQLEAKLGFAAEYQQGDSATANLLNTAQAINNATAGHEKLNQAMAVASELNNYTDPNYIENVCYDFINEIIGFVNFDLAGAHIILYLLLVLQSVDTTKLLIFRFNKTIHTCKK